jgi:DNA-binding IclR family transcriptional regulator
VTDTHAKRDSVRTVDRITTILRVLDGRTSLSLAGVANAARLNPPTTLRLLRALVVQDFVERDVEGRYRLGTSVLAISTKFDRANRLRPIAGPIIRQLAADTDRTTFLLVLSGHEAVCVDRAEAYGAIRVQFVDVGDRMPLTGGAGPMVLLAFGASEAGGQVWKRVTTRLPAARRLDLMAEAEKIRVDGYATGKVESHGKTYHGTLSIGVPVWTATEGLIGAISLAGLAPEVAGGTIEDLLTHLKYAARRVTEGLAHVERNRGERYVDGGPHDEATQS